MKFQTRAKGKPSIQITSLIDLMFTIIIFLLVTTTFVEKPAVQIELPHGHQSQKIEEEKITLSITADGKIFLNHDEIALTQLPGKLKMEKSRLKDPMVTLEADKKAAYGLAIEVMDQIQLAGFKRVIALTEPEARIQN
ncbi:MAG: biopolymer transporter ExbD [Chlamydiae bacterium]|nr:biopolymer transporter ExbD [Chlamydiota bacterium]MBI3266676.1 biopolymer transporter ExbD [Chlamydiota bacterium]